MTNFALVGILYSWERTCTRHLPKAASLLPVERAAQWRRSEHGCDGDASVYVWGHVQRRRRLQAQVGARWRHGEVGEDGRWAGDVTDRCAGRHGGRVSAQLVDEDAVCGGRRRRAAAAARGGWDWAAAWAAAPGRQTAAARRRWRPARRSQRPTTRSRAVRPSAERCLPPAVTPSCPASPPHLQYTQ